MLLKWYNSGHALCIPGTEQWHNIQAIYVRRRERLTSYPKNVQSQVSIVISRHETQLTWAEWLRGSQDIDGRISGWPVSLVETPINRPVVFRTSNGQTVGSSTRRMPWCSPLVHFHKQHASIALGVSAIQYCVVFAGYMARLSSGLVWNPILLVRFQWSLLLEQPPSTP